MWWWWDCDVICSIIFSSILFSACICLGFGWNNHSFSFAAYRIVCTEVWQGMWAVNFVSIHCSSLAWLCTCFSPLCSLWLLWVTLEVKCTVNPVFRGLMWRGQGKKWDTDPKYNTWGRAEADAANERRIYRGTTMRFLTCFGKDFAGR